MTVLTSERAAEDEAMLLDHDIAVFDAIDVIRGC